MAVGDIKGAKELQAAFDALRRKLPKAALRAMDRCGLLAMREAKRNAPRSPTMKILSQSLKKKKRTRRRTHPGGLEKSIEYEATPEKAVVFVARNSYAGKYARYIHDEKGKRWWNRGVGTEAKGRRADEKFIARAIDDNREKFFKTIKSEIGKAMTL